MRQNSRVEPVLIECTLCHKRYKLDLGKMQEMGVLNPLCPACKTPLPVTMPAPAAIAQDNLVATGPISTNAINQALNSNAPSRPVTLPLPPVAPPPPREATPSPFIPAPYSPPTPAAPAAAPPRLPASAIPTAPTPVVSAAPPAPVTAPQQLLVTNPTPHISATSDSQPLPPLDFSSPPPGSEPAPAPALPPEDEMEQPDIGESTMSSAAMAAAMAARNKLPPGYNFTLSGMDGPAAGHKLTLAQSRVVIGRKRGEFILEGDSEASSEHAAVEVRALGSYFLTDLGSTNGTFLNEKKIAGTVALSDRDIIRAGGSSLLFVVTVLEDEHLPPPAAVAPEVLAPPPGAIVTGALGNAGPAPVPAPEEEEDMPEGLPGYLPKPTPVPPNYRFYLKFMEGDMTGEVFEMKGGRGYTLGRSRECDVPLGDIKASRVHTKIYILGVDKYFVQDMGSTNGTFLNEQKVLDILPLKNQDQVRVGLTKLKFIVLKLPPGQSGL
jgi:pSer/pThr/pTyr-binding forkhead associated (FHA) protein